jgi:hypothetical protein
VHETDSSVVLVASRTPREQYAEPMCIPRECILTMTPLREPVEPRRRIASIER